MIISQFCKHCHTVIPIPLDLITCCITWGLGHLICVIEELDSMTSAETLWKQVEYKEVADYLKHKHVLHVTSMAPHKLLLGIPTMRSTPGRWPLVVWPASGPRTQCNKNNYWKVGILRNTYSALSATTVLAAPWPYLVWGYGLHWQNPILKISNWWERWRAQRKERKCWRLLVLRIVILVVKCGSWVYCCIATWLLLQSRGLSHKFRNKS